MKRIFWLAGVVAVGLFTQTLSASVIGTVNEANCGGGGVTVNSTEIIWAPTGSGGSSTGCIITGLGTSLTWSGSGSLGANVTGYIQDEEPPSPTAPPLPFMVFTGTNGTLDFNLTNNFAFTAPSGYQGSGSAACATATSVAGDSCTVSGTSPFLLVGNGNGTTTVDLFASGTVVDPNNSSVSTWAGTFTTQLTETPTAVYNTITGGGSVDSTQSAQFSVTVNAVPEPGSISMFLLGGTLLMAAWTGKSKKAKKA